jgi:hypothetical protein
MTKHRCPRLPRYTQIEYDWQWKWCWTTKDIMETIDYCPYCGAKLTEPTVTHIEMLQDLVDIHGATVLRKGEVCKVVMENNEIYKVCDDNDDTWIVTKKQRGILYKCKEVL